MPSDGPRNLRRLYERKGLAADYERRHLLAPVSHFRLATKDLAKLDMGFHKAHNVSISFVFIVTGAAVSALLGIIRTPGRYTYVASPTVKIRCDVAGGCSLLPCTVKNKIVMSRRGNNSMGGDFCTCRKAPMKYCEYSSPIATIHTKTEKQVSVD